MTGFNFHEFQDECEEYVMVCWAEVTTTEIDSNIQYLDVC